MDKKGQEEKEKAMRIIKALIVHSENDKEHLQILDSSLELIYQAGEQHGILEGLEASKKGFDKAMRTVFGKKK